MLGKNSKSDHSHFILHLSSSLIRYPIPFHTILSEPHCHYINSQTIINKYIRGWGVHSTQERKKCRKKGKSEGEEKKKIQMFHVKGFPMACTVTTQLHKMYLTRERAFISVCTDVCLQTSAPHEALITQSTTVRPLSCMNAHMIPQGTTIRKTGITEFTHVGFLLHTGQCSLEHKIPCLSIPANQRPTYSTSTQVL